MSVVQPENPPPQPDKPHLRRLPLLILWLGVIFATSCTFIDRARFLGWMNHVLPTRGMRDGFATFWDNGGALLMVKGYHMTEFGLLFWLGFRLLATRMPYKKAAALAALGALFYAATDEFHQTFVPGRGGTWVDVVIDSVGISIAMFLTLRRHRSRHDTSTR